MKTFKSLLLILIVSFTLSACKNVDREVDLTPEARQALNTEVEQLTQEIAKQEQEAKVDHLKVIELARAHENLGQITQAIKVYENHLKTHSEMAVINNLAVLYAQAGQNNKAIAQYQRLVDEFGEASYLNEIARIYGNEGDLEKAEATYKAWKKATGATDELTEQLINALKKTE